ncbi:MAG: hypothetical protein J6328_07220 [Bacilli bacterium]|nr:hypothetical protein [Bacilli bacterium]
MLLQKSHLTYRPLLIDEELDFADFDFKGFYPILGVKNLRISSEWSRDNDVCHAKISLSGVVVLEDSYTAKPFEKKIRHSEEIDILEEENGEADGFIVPGKFIDVNELSLELIRFALPIKVLAPGSTLPKSGAQYSVRSAEEDVEETSSPFDALLDLDLPDKND